MRSTDVPGLPEEQHERIRVPLHVQRPLTRLVNGDPTHRAGPATSGDFNDFEAYHLQTIRDLRDADVLERRNRCYALPSPPSAAGLTDHRLQLPRKLAMMGRGAGPEHALRINVNDDVEAGKADGRFARTELRLGLIDYEGVTDRVHLELNGQQIPFQPRRTIDNSRGDKWLVFEDAPIRDGVNTVLVLLQGAQTPDPWPTLKYCELLLLAE